MIGDVYYISFQNRSTQPGSEVYIEISTDPLTHNKYLRVMGSKIRICNLNKIIMNRGRKGRYNPRIFNEFKFLKNCDIDFTYSELKDMLTSTDSDIVTLIEDTIINLFKNIQNEYEIE